MISSELLFHIGDKVVYPNHGVGVIEQISSRTIGATVEKFYLLKIKSSSLKVMVPFHNADAVGLRPVVRQNDINKIIDFLTDSDPKSAADWKERFKENSDKMRTGSLLEVAAVLKGLLLLNQTKPLSFREKKMLERARYLLVSELAMAKNLEESAVEQLLSKALAKCKLRFPEAAEFQAYSLSLIFIFLRWVSAKSRVSTSSAATYSPNHAPYGRNGSMWSNTIFVAAVNGIASTSPIAPHSQPQNRSEIVTARGLSCSLFPRNLG